MHFITFEGGEGSGKTTQSKLLNESFNKSGIKSVYTREPGGVKSAEVIRNLLLEEDFNFSTISELLLINAARYEHAVKLIMPNLKNNFTVISDRFVDSTLAYQGFGKKLGKKLPAIIHNLIMPNLSPNLTFIMDIPAKEGLARVKNKNNYENYSVEFHEKVRNGFLEIAKMAPTRCVLINSKKSIDTIHHEIINKINETFNINLKITNFSELV